MPKQPAFAILSLLCALACTPAPAADSPTPTDADPNLQSLRIRALEHIFVLRDFRPGKNSFVENAERHVGSWTNTGFRRTLLDVQGQGSLRHIWTTRGPGEPNLDWEFYVDGETQPSVRGTDFNLVEAARDVQVPVAPANYIPIDNRAFNFYLPVPFEQSLRVDVVQRVPSFWLWFCQLDYRLNDSSLKGARLLSRNHGTNLTLSYIGLQHQQLEHPTSTLPRVPVDIPEKTLAPGEQLTLARVPGPGIIRELRLRWPTNASLELRIRYDTASGFAVRSPVDRFFGPFQGVSFFQHAPGDATCFLPMPFRSTFELLLLNQSPEPANIQGQLLVEHVPAFAPSWGHFHALHQKTERTDGHRPHQVLYARGRGHWLGMTLYKTGHDHGGGDFAVVDGEGGSPAFLHGVNGEDYFTFAWFGKGAHHPYAVAHSNDDGRYRHHFENVYPFTKSIAIEWGAFPDLTPESLAVWYQDSPEDTTVADGARTDSTQWDVFGPVPIPHDQAGRSTVDPFSVLPSVADLDAGKQFQCRLVKETFLSGWQKEWSVGPMLNLTYIGRHHSKVNPEGELGGMGHAMLARRFITADRDHKLPCLFAHDDPAEIWVNNRRIYQGPSHPGGFESTSIRLPLQKGKNEVLVKLTNYFNRNFNWAGFLLRPGEN